MKTALSAFSFLRGAGGEDSSSARTPMSHFQVAIDDIRFGILNIDPEKTIPNPQEATWNLQNEVAELNTIGDMPKTEPTIPNGLWNFTLIFTCTNEIYFDAFLNLDLGPHRVKTYRHEECMLLISKKYSQKEKTKDNITYWTLTFKKNNPG